MTKLLKEHGGAVASLIAILVLAGGFAAYVIGSAEARAVTAVQPLEKSITEYREDVKGFREDIRELYRFQLTGQRSAKLEAPAVAEDVP